MQITNFATSPDGLRRLFAHAMNQRFRVATGKSILEEILNVRFQKLMPLLEQGHIPLASLADLTGFSSENHLQRQFKARFGMTLSDYRRKSQGGHLRADRTPRA